MSYDYSMGVNYMPMTSTYVSQGNAVTNLQESVPIKQNKNLEKRFQQLFRIIFLLVTN